MASILDKYGIKEVADVVFYELDSKGAPSAPVLYLDTLKVSTIEQSAEIVDATGGKGNVKLISWDTNKEVTATFEDALFSVKSLAIMFGGEVVYGGSGGQEVLKTVGEAATSVHGDAGSEDGLIVDIGNHKVFIDKDKALFYKYTNDVLGKGSITDFEYVTFDLLDAAELDANGEPKTGDTGGHVSGLTIRIDASTFGGTYYITGDTYARNQESGKDEYLQFIIPKGKVSSEDLSLTMEADGDPATFSMNVNVLRAADGTMFKLVKYAFGSDAAGDKNKGVASVLKDEDAKVGSDYDTTNFDKVTGSRP